MTTETENTKRFEYYNVEQLKKQVNIDQMWKSIFDHIPDSIIVLSVDNRVIMANRATETLFNVNIEDIIGKQCFSFVHGTLKPIDQCPHVQCMIKRESIRKIIYEPKYSKYLEVIVIPIFQGKEILATIHIARNLKDIIKENETLKVLNKELETRNELIKSMVGTISHDLRSPLSLIKGYNDIIQMKSNDDKIKQYSTKINNAVNTISDIIEKVVSILKFHRKIVKIQKDEILFPEFINVIVDDMKILMDKKNISCSVNVDVPYKIKTDKTLLSSVINNVISNAIKFTPRGGRISIQSYIEGNMVVIKISDNGIGMPEDIRANVLKPSRVGVHRKGTDGEEGSGIGLDICNHIIKIIGGKIEIESEVGKGTDVSIKVPVE